MEKSIKERALTGTPCAEPRPYEALHARLARRAAAEGMVLLKNENHTLPLKSGSKIALFGAGASQTIKGGTGSGDVNERKNVRIYHGLLEAGYQITTEKWIMDFEQKYQIARLAWKQDILNKKREYEKAGVSNAFFSAYSRHPFILPAGAPAYQTDADAAVYVLSRIAGENADRHATGGDYYLSSEEHQLLADICRMYAKTIVIVNTGGIVDLSFLDEFPSIQALLFISQPGMEGGHAVADVLSGAVNPSGKLTDTWAFHYRDYPNAEAFLQNGKSLEEEKYEEGIYVGYRYFDSFEIPVRYGFGYGGSYTTFNLHTVSVSVEEDGTVSVTVSVTNTGTVPGKEVVQVYAALPDGRLEKEARRLVAFEKTRLLAPNERQLFTLHFGAAQLESYDEANAAWILEAGLYGVYVGNSLESSKLTAALELTEDKVLTKAEHICPPQHLLHLASRSPTQRLARYLSWKSTVASTSIIPYDLSAVQTHAVDYTISECMDEAASLVEQLTVEQLIQLATGDPCKGQDSALGCSGVSVPGSAAETSSCALNQGIANITLADGPAGLRLTQIYSVKEGLSVSAPMEVNMEHGFFYDGPEPEGTKYYQYCTAIPVGTLLAQTWDIFLLQEIGSIIGDEMEEFCIQLWLAPGMNIHRNPLCGRNFEYFSEDPLVSGRCAAAIIRGVQSHYGIGATVKHYACNNQEENRMHSDSILTERTLREIYLKGFEIAIHEAHPFAIMTSYNRINGIHAANNYDLCTKAARCEFGFDGVIMTDWSTTNIDDSCTAAGCIRAGNDVVMPGLPMDHENLRKSLADGTLKEKDLKQCITHLVRIILCTNRYEK